jgi:hypothetical protein
LESRLTLDVGGFLLFWYLCSLPNLDFPEYAKHAGTASYQQLYDWPKSGMEAIECSLQVVDPENSK